MAAIAIQVEQLGKRYRLGQTHEALLRHRIDRWLGRLWSGEGNRTERHPHLWALREVSFSVAQGEVVGVIGANGAGKSTLLKVLSRITPPTEGRARLRGRLASLLEVGTGFHPELTGLENIYLNGAILGMTRSEIARKFDRIVEFAEVARFLDTPVKRYSSGMYVRLAFAVAAHLEPEILLVDEVLAVGDAAFQKKCLGKMDEVARAGRTVLFVSHNMAAIQHLCPRSLLLAAGRLEMDGPTPQVVEAYLKRIEAAGDQDLARRQDRLGEGRIRFDRIELLDQDGKPTAYGVSGRPLRVRLHYRARTPGLFRHCRVGLSVHGRGRPFFLAAPELVSTEEVVLEGQGYLECVIDRLPLSRGEYWLSTFLESNRIIQDWVEAAGRLSVVDGDFYGTGRNYPPGWDGQTVLVDHRWQWDNPGVGVALRKGA